MMPFYPSKYVDHFLISMDGHGFFFKKLDLYVGLSTQGLS